MECCERSAAGPLSKNRRDGLLVYVENAGEFRVPFAAVSAVHYRKVVFDCRNLDRRLRQAIGHAHEAEVPGL